MIPRIAHFIWFGPQEHQRAAEYAENRRSFVLHNPSWQVMYWTWEKLREHFDMSYVESLSSPYAQSDYVRLVILEKFGGMYLDQDVICFGAIDPRVLDDEKINMPSLVGMNNTVNNCMIASKPSMPVMEDFIREGKRRYHTHVLGRMKRFVSICWGPDMFNEMLPEYKGSIHVLPETFLFDHHSTNAPAKKPYTFFHRSLVGWRLQDNFSKI